MGKYDEMGENRQNTKMKTKKERAKMVKSQIA